MKGLIKFCLTIIFLCAVFVAFLPKIASTKWGLPIVLRLIDREIPGKITVEALTLSWKGPQKATDLVWQSSQMTFKTPQIESSEGLFTLLFKRDFGVAKLSSPELFLGKENLEPLLPSKATLLPSFNPIKWSGTLEIENGLVKYQDDTLSGITATCEKTKEKLSLQIQGNLEKNIPIEAKATISFKDNAFAMQGISSLSTSEKGVFEIGGKFARNTIYEWRSGGKNLPTEFLELLCRLMIEKNLPLTAMLGEKTDFVFNYENNGPMEFFLEAPYGGGKVTGKMLDGILHLETPMEAELLLSRALNQALFPKEFGIFEVRSNRRVTLQISPQGTRIPLLHWNPQQVTIDKGRIDLSVITCHMPSTVGELFNFLHQERLRDAPIELWFSPLDFSVQTGLLTIDRTDFLMDKTFHLCLWGEYDLIRQRLALTLGITAPTLQRIFNLQGLPSDYVLHIPVKISNGQVKINFKKGAAKVAKLILWHKACAAGLPPPPFPKEKQPTPPPKLPLPWDQTLVFIKQVLE